MQVKLRNVKCKYWTIQTRLTNIQQWCPTVTACCFHPSVKRYKYKKRQLRKAAVLGGRVCTGKARDDGYFLVIFKCFLFLNISF